jgi:hypothetical protein
MKGLWVRIAIVSAALVAINLLARVGVRIAGPGDDAEFVIALWSLGAMVLGLAVVIFYWTRRYLASRVVAYAGAVIGISSVFVAVLGPFVSGGGPLENGFGSFLLQLFVIALSLTVGATLGLLLAMALGLDPTSRAWKNQSERVRNSPRQRQGRTARR